MLKLAFAIGFMAVFGGIFWLAFTVIVKKYFTPTETKKGEKSVDTSQTTTEQNKTKN